MLSLAHGVKGVFFEPYYTYKSWYGDPLNQYIWVDAIVDTFQNGGFPESDNYWKIQSLAERLNANLGNRLIELGYTGDYIIARYFIPTDNPSPQTYEYLTLPYNQTSTTMNWHAGFFNKNGYSDDNYFFLVNLLPETNKSVLIGLTPPVSGYTNYRFRNYEGIFDTTFTGSFFTYTLTHPAGEGYLYEV